VFNVVGPALVVISVLVLLSVWQASEAYALPVSQAHLDHTYNLQISNQTYAIKYGMTGRNGTVEEMSANPSSKSIMITINDNSAKGGLFSVELPRAVLDANTTTEEVATGCSYTANGTIVWSRDHDIPFRTIVSYGAITTTNDSFPDERVNGEICNRDSRIVTITYPAGKSEIEIIGTSMVPEYGTSFLALMTIMMVGIGTTIFVNRGRRSRLNNKNKMMESDGKSIDGSI
jgi:hypothetical protein